MPRPASAGAQCVAPTALHPLFGTPYSPQELSWSPLIFAKEALEESEICGNKCVIKCREVIGKGNSEIAIETTVTKMDQENQTSEVTFILLGFSEYPHLQMPLFLVFLTIYTVTVLGNLGMIMVIRISPKLHTPMYFFLSHLSFVDFCYSTTVTPKLLENLVVEDRTISFTGCIMQFFFVCIFVGTETFMLAVMAYDRYVVVCNSLLYTVAMSQRLCSVLVATSHSWGIVCSLTLTYFLLELSFRGNNIINNFVCEHAAIVAVFCSDPYVSQEITLVLATFDEISSLMMIFTSYAFIFITVVKMPSTGGRKKALSTCASHLTAITIFHGTILFLYCVPNSKSSWLMVEVTSVFYTVVIPMLNPLIYSLRKKDVLQRWCLVYSACLAQPLAEGSVQVKECRNWSEQVQNQLLWCQQEQTPYEPQGSIQVGCL
nr:LOW QUALITY PROTEIN: olfactory receptor 5D13-like [Symphalangus syndactylus]